MNQQDRPDFDPEKFKKAKERWKRKPKAERELTKDEWLNANKSYFGESNITELDSENDEDDDIEQELNFD